MTQSRRPPSPRGIDEALSVVDHAGWVELAMSDAYAQLRDLAAAAAGGRDGAAARQ